MQVKTLSRLILSVVAFCSLSAIYGCGSTDDTPVIAGTAHPQDISGTWAGYRSNPSLTFETRYETRMTLTQTGANITGTYTTATGTDVMHPDSRESDIVGTYNSESGVFQWGTANYTFITDNEMVLTRGAGTDQYSVTRLWRR